MNTDNLLALTSNMYETIKIVADNPNNPTRGKFESLSQMLIFALNLMTGIGVAVATIGIIYSGYMFVSGQGNPANFQKAKDSLTYSIFGLVLAMGAVAIRAIIANALGASAVYQDAVPTFN